MNNTNNMINMINVDTYIDSLNELKMSNITKLDEFKKNINLLNEIIDNLNNDKNVLSRDIKDLLNTSDEMIVLMKNINININ